MKGFTTRGLVCLAKALTAYPFRCRFEGGGWKSEPFPCEEGYPLMADEDRSNPGRGEYVVSWKFVVPRGVAFPAVVTEIALLDEEDGIVYKDVLDTPLRTSPAHASTQFVNLVFRALN